MSVMLLLNTYRRLVKPTNDEFQEMRLAAVRAMDSGGEVTLAHGLTGVKLEITFGRKKAKAVKLDNPDKPTPRPRKPRVDKKAD